MGKIRGRNPFGPQIGRQKIYGKKRKIKQKPILFLHKKYAIIKFAKIMQKRCNLLQRFFIFKNLLLSRYGTKRLHFLQDSKQRNIS